MLLAINIGNTQTTLGIFQEGRLFFTRRFRTNSLESEREARRCLRSVDQKARLSGKKEFDLVVASVVPHQTSLFARIAKKMFRIRPLIVSGTLDCGIRILYDKPSELGADRLCNAVAAYHKFGGPIIVVDFGTATKFEAVSRGGDYLGGAIAVGIRTAAEALHKRTARLPEVKLQFPKNVVGTNTIMCIQSGVLMNAVSAMEGMVKRFKKTTGRNTKVILTGGYSSLIASHTTIIDRVEPYLVLEGARLIYERVVGKKK